MHPKNRKIKGAKLHEVVLHNFDHQLSTDTERSATLGTSVMYNFDFSSGALKGGLGLKKLYLPNSDDVDRVMRVVDDFPSDVERVWVYRYYDQYGIHWSNLVAYCTDGYMYTTFIEQPTSEVQIESRFQLTECPLLLNYRYEGRDIAILTTSEDGMILWDANYANDNIFVKNGMFSVFNLYVPGPNTSAI